MKVYPQILIILFTFSAKCLCDALVTELVPEKILSIDEYYLDDMSIYNNKLLITVQNKNPKKEEISELLEYDLQDNTLRSVTHLLKYSEYRVPITNIHTNPELSEIWLSTADHAERCYDEDFNKCAMPSNKNLSTLRKIYSSGLSSFESAYNYKDYSAFGEFKGDIYFCESSNKQCTLVDDNPKQYWWAEDVAIDDCLAYYLVQAKVMVFDISSKKKLNEIYKFPFNASAIESDGKFLYLGVDCRYKNCGIYRVKIKESQCNLLKTKKGIVERFFDIFN